MALVKLDKAVWHRYFDQMSKSLLVGKEVEIDVTGMKIGAQIEQEWIQLQGMVYDHKDNLLEILVEGLDHLIHKPKEIYIDHTALGLSSMEVIGDDDVREVIRLREPLMLAYSGGS
jgi:hypothetical protein